LTHQSVDRYQRFNAELIVEVTIVCDRACLGCYAPNVILRNDHESSLRQRPELFLHPDVLRDRIVEITSSIGRPLESLSFRGGEPTCHPRLPKLVELSMEHTKQLFVETHGRWALPETQGTGLDVGAVIDALRRPNVCVKVSFDSMHKISPEELERLLEVFDHNRVNWLVAITEADHKQFLEQRNRCTWIPDSKIIFQPKAVNAFQLYAPPLGVVRTGGEHSRVLTAKANF
jgi:uncharacterized Fe-S cluster-containing radical SAM superfamily protein